MFAFQQPSDSGFLEVSACIAEKSVFHLLCVVLQHAHVSLFVCFFWSDSNTTFWQKTGLICELRA